MKFFVISDTHGNLAKVYEVFKSLTGIDAIIHLGDMENDAEILKKELGIDVISVKGNMDGAYSTSAFEILETECGKLYLAHGHMENVKSQYQNIYYKALEADCVAALFGHTHRPIFESLNGIHLINPGSLSLPSDGTQGSYAIINTYAQGLSGSIIYYKSPPKTHSSSDGNKVQGGYLRDMLNYSDRF